MGRFKNPGGSQLPNHQIGAAVFDVERIRDVTGAKFVFIPIAAEQFQYLFLCGCLHPQLG